MLRRLFDQLADALSDNEAASDDDRTQAIQQATAVLMLDVALADRVVDESEIARVLALIEARFSLSDVAATELVESARSKAEDLVSLHEFTQLLHENLHVDEKAAIVGMLWEVAYADGELDRHEDALILKISDLLFVNRARVMRLKHDAKLAANA